MEVVSSSLATASTVAFHEFEASAKFDRRKIKNLTLAEYLERCDYSSRKRK